MRSGRGEGSGEKLLESLVVVWCVVGRPPQTCLPPQTFPPVVMKRILRLLATVALRSLSHLHHLYVVVEALARDGHEVGLPRIENRLFNSLRIDVIVDRLVWKPLRVDGEVWGGVRPGQGVAILR